MNKEPVSLRAASVSFRAEKRKVKPKKLYERIETTRLVLEKREGTLDNVIKYDLVLKEPVEHVNASIGTITIFFNLLEVKIDKVNYRGKGYMNEAMTKLMEVALEGRYKVEINPTNEDSINLFAGLGFTEKEKGTYTKYIV